MEMERRGVEYGNIHLKLELSSKKSDLVGAEWKAQDFGGEAMVMAVTVA